MTTTSAEALIDLPRSAAWAKLEDLMLAERYVPGVTRIEIVTPHDRGIGACRKVYTEKRPPFDETVVEWIEGYGFTVRVHDGDKPSPPFRAFRFRYRLDDAPGGKTRFTATMIYELPWGVLGRVLDAVVMRRIVGRMAQTIAHNVKRVYESDARAGKIAPGEKGAGG